MNIGKPNVGRIIICINTNRLDAYIFSAYHRIICWKEQKIYEKQQQQINILNKC